MTTITPLPPPPLASDSPAVFNAKAFATLAAQVDMVDQINAALGEFETAVDAAEGFAGDAAGSASAAAASATTATSQAGVASGHASTAAGHASAAATSASNAAASASAAAGSASSAAGTVAAALATLQTTIGRAGASSGGTSPLVGGSVRLHEVTFTPALSGPIVVTCSLLASFSGAGSGAWDRTKHALGVFCEQSGVTVEMSPEPTDTASRRYTLRGVFDVVAGSPVKFGIYFVYGAGGISWSQNNVLSVAQLLPG